LSHRLIKIFHLGHCTLNVILFRGNPAYKLFLNIKYRRRDKWEGITFLEINLPMNKYKYIICLLKPHRKNEVHIFKLEEPIYQINKKKILKKSLILKGVIGVPLFSILPHKIRFFNISSILESAPLSPRPAINSVFISRAPFYFPANKVVKQSFVTLISQLVFSIFHATLLTIMDKRRDLGPREMTDHFEGLWRV